MIGPKNPSQGGLPPDKEDLGDGRTWPRDLRRALRSVLVRHLAIAGLAPFVLLISLGFVPATAMLAIAGLFNDLIWVHFRQISFLDCGDRCWARAYTLISATVLGLSMAVLGVFALRTAVVTFATSEEALRCGAAPWGLTSRGAIARGPRPSAYFVWLLALAVGLLVVWWLASIVSTKAGSNWSGSSRRGLNIPAVFSFYWTGVLAILQLLASFCIIFSSMFVLGIYKSLRFRIAGS